MQSCFMFLFATPYLGFKEVLGSFDSLNGDIYLWELCKSQQAAVLFKFPSCSFMEYQQELARQRRNIQVLCWGENLKVQAEQTFIWEVGIYISEQRKPVLYKPNSTMQLVLQCPGSTTQPYWTNKSNIFYYYLLLFIYLFKEKRVFCGTKPWWITAPRPLQGRRKEPISTCPVQPYGGPWSSILCPHTLMLYHSPPSSFPTVLGSQITSHRNESRAKTGLSHTQTPASLDRGASTTLLGRTSAQRCALESNLETAQLPRILPSVLSKPNCLYSTGGENQIKVKCMKNNRTRSLQLVLAEYTGKAT